MDFSDILAISIDDSQQNLFLIEAYAEEFGLKIVSYDDPRMAWDFLQENEVDIVFTDYMMPKLDGITLISQIRQKNYDYPIVMITAIDEEDTKIKALEAGATDFLNKPLDFAEFMARTKNLLSLRMAQKKLKNRAILLEEEVEKATIEIVAREHESLIILGKTAEYKDPETGAHVARVAHYSKMLALKYGLDEEEQEIIFYASPFHDIGKVGIADAILLKPGRLDEPEFDTMKKHALIGYDILKNSKSKFLKRGAQIALTHHEKYDGTGYPYGIKGEEIALCGRIVAVADVFDALTSKRPYKEPWSFEKTIAFLEEQKGKHFDPKIVDLFIESINEVEKIFEKFQE